jgi:hypothetical protein
MLITASPSQMQMDLESNSLLNIANASSDGDSGGDDKKDDKKDKDDDKDKDDEKDEEKDDNEEKDEGSEDNKESEENTDSDSNDSNGDSKDEDTSEDSKDEQTTKSQTDVSDATQESDVEQTAETQESDVSSISSVSDEETSETFAPQDLEPQATTTLQTISPQTDESSLAGVADEGQTPEAITEEITENQESRQDPEINEAKVQEVSDKIIENLQEEELSEDLRDHIKTILSNEYKNNPNGELATSLEVLAGMNEFFVFETPPEIEIAKRIIAENPEINKFDIPFLTQMINKGVGENSNRILGIAIDDEIYDDKGNLVETKVLTEITANKSSDSKSSSSKKDKNNKQDINCDDIKYKNIKVSADDPYNLDGDGDGIGCESNNDDDRNNHYYIKKIIKYQGSKCTTQSGSIPLAGKIPPKTPILIGDFYPCKLNDGRATLNLPNTPNLQFALIHLDKKDGNHEAVVVSPQKIQNIDQNNALFVVNFNDQFQGQDPITGQSKTIKDVNAIALYNKARQTLDFEDGNGLGITAVLKS